MTGWSAGAASTFVDVPIGTPMAGYAARFGPSIGTLDGLTVSCLLLACDDGQFAIVAIDLVAVDFEMVIEIAERIGVAPDRLAVCASHTHSGPAGVAARLHPAERPEFDQIMREAFISAAITAHSRASAALERAEIRYGAVVVEGVSANRLSPDGVNDATATVLTATAMTGASIATFVHFACHPTVLPAESRMISADFPGTIRRSLCSDRFGTVLFANGAAGDISTRFTRTSQDERELERIGRVFAGCMDSMGPLTPIDPSILATTLNATLTPRSDDELQKELGMARHVSAQRPAHERVEATRRQGIELLKSMANIDAISPVDVHIGIWRLGKVTLVGVPGELFASLGLELAHAIDDPTLILGYTNGYAGYFPDQHAYNTGSYEALASPWSSAVVNDLVDTIRRSL